MGFLSGRSGLAPRAEINRDGWTPGAGGSYGLMSDSGVVVGPETVQRCGAVWGAVRFRSKVPAMCPAHVVRWVDERTREKAPDHYVQRVLDDPNSWQTYQEWLELNLLWVSIWGNAYNRIVPGAMSFVDQLRPLHPSRVRVIDQLNDGTFVYEYSPFSKGIVGKPERLTSSDLLHFRGPASDTSGGKAMYELIRQAVGIALSAEKHASKFLKKGARIGGVLTSKGTLSKEAAKVAEDSLSVAWGGPEAEGKIVFVPSELDFKAITLDHQKSQFHEMRDFQVAEVLRFLEVPGVVVGYADKTATYASADAFFEKGGLVLCIQPIVINVEQRITKDLFFKGDPHMVKLNMRAIRRINTKDQFEAYAKGINAGFLSRNEVRAWEDLNPGPEELDEFLEPENMREAGTGGDEPEPEPQPRPSPKPAPPADDDEDAEAREQRPLVVAVERAEIQRQDRAERLATAAALRVIRREKAEILGTEGKRVRKPPAERFAGDPKGWQGWVEQYYERHATFVAAALDIDVEQALAYTQAQKAELLEKGVGVVATWEETKLEQLVALALGEQTEAAA